MYRWGNLFVELYFAAALLALFLNLLLIATHNNFDVCSVSLPS